MMQFSSIKAYVNSVRDGSVDPKEYILSLLKELRKDTSNSYICVLDDSLVLSYIEEAKEKFSNGSLYMVPFLIKDNIDLEGVPTTAACKEFSYIPKHSATAVKLLLEQGAIPLAKTNMDQFATGLVGVRSPYGVCKNSFNQEYVSGGSSSGSAVGVAKGHALFSLGTDTAGSGRVPAAFNNIFGLKGTVGAVSINGVVPACKTLDCLTVFAKSTDDLKTVFSVIRQYDKDDICSRHYVENDLFSKTFTFGVPDKKSLEFFNDTQASLLFDNAVESLKSIGGIAVTIDISPFVNAAKLLYEGSFVAERFAGNREFFEKDLDKCLDVIRTIIGNSQKFSAVDSYNDRYKLLEYKRVADEILDKVDFIVTPTAPTIYSIKEVLADPIKLNSNIGYYTNFMNLLDFSAIAVPAGFRQTGEKKDLPFGVTFFTKAFKDDALLDIAARYSNYTRYPLGSMLLPFNVVEESSKVSDSTECQLCVCGAHLKGFALNSQLSDLGGRFVKSTRTSKNYRMYIVSDDGKVIKPGLVRNSDNGESLEVEVYSISKDKLGYFMQLIPYPLGIGRVELESSDYVLGFICEGEAVKGKMDITSYGGYRAYMQSIGKSS